MRSIITSLLVMALSAPVSAQDDLTAVFFEFNEGSAAQLNLALSSCSDNPECDVVRLTCGSYNSMSVMMIGFSDRDVANWLLSSGAILLLRNDYRSLPVMPYKIVFNELNNEGWVMTFLPTAGVREWLDAIDFDKGLSIRTIQGDLLFPDKAGDLNAIKSFVNFCLDVVRY